MYAGFFGVIVLFAFITEFDEYGKRNRKRIGKEENKIQTRMEVELNKCSYTFCRIRFSSKLIFNMTSTMCKPTAEQ